MGDQKRNKKKLDMAIALYESKQYTLQQIKEHTSVSPTSLYRELEKRKENQEY